MGSSPRGVQTNSDYNFNSLNRTITNKIYIEIRSEKRNFTKKKHQEKSKSSGKFTNVDIANETEYKKTYCQKISL